MGIVANRRGHQVVEWSTDTDTEEAREFASAPEWPRTKALAYLHNNTNAPGVRLVPSQVKVLILSP